MMLHPQPLIHAVVQQTIILVAHLATAGGVRAPLAGVANRIFADLSDQVAAQGVARSVVADMFGMALSTFHRRARAAAQSQTDAERTVWEAVLDFVRKEEPVAAAAVLTRFSRDPATVVTSVLKDLADSGLVYRSGRGASTVYRIAHETDFKSPESGRVSAVRHLVWLHIVRQGPIGLEAIANQSRESLEECQKAIDSLIASDLVQVRGRGASAVYESNRLDVPVGTGEGWEAAVLDHFQAVVTALCVKLRAGSARSMREDVVGGGTFTLDVWPGHPLEGEARGTLARVRSLIIDLRERIDQYNAEHPRAEGGSDSEVTVYFGQYVKTNDEAGEGLDD